MFLLCCLKFTYTLQPTNTNVHIKLLQIEIFNIYSLFGAFLFKLVRFLLIFYLKIADKYQHLSGLFF